MVSRRGPESPSFHSGPPPMPLRPSCYNRALDALARRARSRAELRRWLIEREYPAEEVEPVLERLVAGRLLDDLAFARGFAHARLGAGRGFGPARVRPVISHGWRRPMAGAGMPIASKRPTM